METDIVIPAPWQECHDSSLRTYVGRRTERLREFQMRARNASQNRLQSDWRESLWRSFSFNFSIRPPRGSMETLARFSRVWPSAKLFLRVPPWRRSFDVSRHVCTCMCGRPLLYFASMLPACLWIRATAAYRILLLQSNKRELHAIYIVRLCEGGKVVPYLDEY